MVEVGGSTALVCGWVNPRMYLVSILYGRHALTSAGFIDHRRFNSVGDLIVASMLNLWGQSSLFHVKFMCR